MGILWECGCQPIQEQEQEQEDLVSIRVDVQGTQQSRQEEATTRGCTDCTSCLGEFESDENGVARQEEVTRGCTDCTICLGEFESDENSVARLTLNPCGHRFHELCVEVWLKTRRMCPNCRGVSVGSSDSVQQQSRTTEEQEVVTRGCSDCTICLGEFESDQNGVARLTLKPCGHRFHMLCVEVWLKKEGGKCPTCRGASVELSASFHGRAQPPSIA